jgi:hypothetical protein
MNDQLDMMIVLFIFFVAISYMNFLSIRLKNHSGWTNVTCNPLNLFSNSLFQTSEESNKDFHRCIVQLSKETTTNLFKDQTKLQKDVLLAQTGIRDKYEILNNDVNTYKSSIKESTSDYIKIAKELQKDQLATNTLSDTTSDKTKTFTDKVTSILDNIKAYII